MLKQVLFRHSSKGQFLTAATGALIGFIFLISAVHYFIASKKLGEGEEILGSNILIAQRSVSKFDALNLGNNSFEEQEIEELRALPFVRKVKPIVNNKFNISLGMKEEGLPYFRTDVFVQSVDNDVMDVQVEQWKWTPEDDILPLVMPRDFMIMLNQFAASYGIPQVSEDLAMTFNFKIDITGNRIKESFKARVVGFSNQISAILVPMEFMEYANNKCGDDSKQVITQLMVDVEEGSFGKLEAIMEELNLDIKKNELMIAKVKSILSATLGVILIISILTIVLSALLILQYSQLIISKSDYEITTLLRIGYHPKTLAKTFLIYFTKVFGFLTILSVCAFFVLKMMLDGFLSKAGFPIQQLVSWESLLLLIIVSCGIVFLNYWKIKHYFIKKIYPS